MSTIAQTPGGLPFTHRIGQPGAGGLGSPEGSSTFGAGHHGAATARFAQFLDAGLSGHVAPGAASSAAPEAAVEPRENLAGRSDIGFGQLGIDVEGDRILRVSYYDSDGGKLTTSAFNAPSMLRMIEKFGIPLADLAGLADGLDAAGVPYKPYELYAGTGSDHGVDLRDLAGGGMGTAYDWTEDALVHLKGPRAAERLADNQALAARYGVIDAAPPEPAEAAPIPGATGPAAFAAGLNSRSELLAALDAILGRLATTEK